MQPDEQLEQQLSAAADRARSHGTPQPDAAFAASLRDRLLSQYSPQVAAEEPPLRRRRVGWLIFPRQLRLAPLALAAVLAVATVAGARELYVALVAPPATATPAPSAAPETTLQPTSVPTDAPTEAPTAEPTIAPTPAPTPEPTEQPTPKPTPRPTAKPSPKPTPVPILDMTLAATPCNGGVVLGWSPYAGPSFAVYATLRSTSAGIPASYPPAEGVTKVGTSLTENPAATSAFDASGTAGALYYYRTLALDGAGKVLGASPVTSAAAKPVKALGPMTLAPAAEGTSVTWTPYGGLASCFSYYKIVWSTEHAEPSYLAGDPAVPVEGQGSGVAVLGPEQLVPAQTYFVRVQAIRVTDTGKFVVAQSDVTSYEVPPA
jgi:hypothetical protein